jgi:hypothetical protein
MKSRPPKSEAELHRDCVEYFLREGRPDLAAEAEVASLREADRMYGRHVTESLQAEFLVFKAACRRFRAVLERRRKRQG